MRHWSCAHKIVGLPQRFARCMGPLFSPTTARAAEMAAIVRRKSTLR